MTGFWVTVKGSAEQSSTQSGESYSSESFDATGVTAASFHGTALNSCKQRLSKSHGRLVGWNTELLTSLLKNIVQGRRISKTPMREGAPEPQLEYRDASMPFDEWAQSIELPEEAPKQSKRTSSAKEVELSHTVVAQLRQFVTTIACLHGDNPFHSFDHASHVVSSPEFSWLCSYQEHFLTYPLLLRTNETDYECPQAFAPRYPVRRRFPQSSVRSYYSLCRSPFRSYSRCCK